MKHLGEVLVEKNIITQEQLDHALQEQKQQGGKLGNILVKTGVLTENQLLELLAQQLNMPFFDLTYFEFDHELVKQLPENQARRWKAIILREREDGLLVGMVDPLDIYAYDNLTQILKRPFKLALVREDQLMHNIDMIYRRSEEIISFAAALSDELEEHRFDFSASGELTGEEAPVVKLLQSIFEDALNTHASDIHIEPDANVLRIRQRIDGFLQERIIPERQVSSALTQRLKLMAGLNIAEKRLPQDGRFNITIKQQVIDVRLATMPLQFGEAVVMRLLNQQTNLLNLDNLDMPENILETIRQLIKRPHGMLLVTGPTGSGKTTSLYAMLHELNQVDRKIITVEDPVEYRLQRINQVQVNNKIELTFARVLRAILRHDPDIIMVGEIRDQETVSIALRAAMTGHLVLATLHTNDAASTALRLIDMGAEPFLVASALDAILSQRLVRRICKTCSEPHTLTKNELKYLEGLSIDLPDMNFQHGSGCWHCGNTGYQGRVGVYELLVLNDDMLNALRMHDQQKFIQALQRNSYWESLESNALRLAAKGITTLDEAMRIAFD
ncbi:MAG: MSHA fimbrial ATPase MshE [Gammaproteobacteria bacterium]